jgi:hypothetical protein
VAGVSSANRFTTRRVSVVLRHRELVPELSLEAAGRYPKVV